MPRRVLSGLAALPLLAAFAAWAQAPPATRGAEALSLFGSTEDDRALVFIAWGAPKTRLRVSCAGLFRPLEVWTYAEQPRLGADAPVVFFLETASGQHRYWTIGDGDDALLAPELAGKKGLESASGCAEAAAVREAVARIRARQRDGAGGLAERNAVVVGRAPRAAVKGIEVPAGAGLLIVTPSIRFPEQSGGKTTTELSLMVERASLAPRTLGDEAFYALDVAGEVRKGASAKPLDEFHYRFEFAASALHGTVVPLTIERDLPAGAYSLKVRVLDANRNAAALVEEKMTVPGDAKPSLSKEDEAAESAAREAAQAAAHGATDAGGADGEGGGLGAIVFVPPAADVATGRLRFQTLVRSPEVAYAEFYLDGAKVLTKRRPPFDAEIDLGASPRRRVVKVIGYSKDGKKLSEDELALNQGKEAFRVRIASPAKGVDVRGPTRVVAELSVPGTRRLKQLEIFVDETRAAVLYEPPWEHVVDIPPSDSMGLLRTVATLDDGTTAEDVRYFNAPPFLSEANVRAVELYTAVFAKGRPVTGLSKDSFRVLEDGAPQKVEGFEVVTKLPLALGLALDLSGSMEDSLAEAEKAATKFLEDVMTPKDRCFFVTFNQKVELVSSFTTDRDRIAQALTGLRADGQTAIWDALGLGLYQFQGVRGRKAYVVLTDGEDNASKHHYDDVVDDAKKSGVAVYFVGLKIPSQRLDIRAKLAKIAKETGGVVYYVDSARGLTKIYKQLDEELRSQYVLSYIPTNAAQDGKWRKVEVKMTPADLTARTIAGYYP